MFTQLLQIEQQKNRRRTMFRVELALLLAVVVSVTLILLWVRSMLLNGVTESGNLRIEGIDLPMAEALLTWPMSFELLLGVVSTLLPILMLLLIGTSIAQEYSWRSFQLLLSRGVPRTILLPAKLLAMLASAFLFMTAATLLHAAISGVLSWWLLDQLPLAEIHFHYLLLTMAGILLVVLPYAALALLLGVLSRSTAVSVGLPLLTITLIEPLLRQFLPLLGARWETAVTYLPAALQSSLLPPLLARISDPAVSMSGPVAPWTAALGLLLYGLFFLGAAIAVFHRQDLGG
jgi:ABC-type transport system involved in multi-copper enzyme maturation permease subunit